MSYPVHTMRGMPDPHHPWRWLRESFPDWEVILVPLPAGVLGATDAARRLILLDSRQKQAQRRSTLDHELGHAAAGDIGCQNANREQEIGRASARRLIPFDKLLEVLAWANSPAEAADELWVDLSTFTTRMQHLHPSELSAIRARLASRDNEEG